MILYLKDLIGLDFQVHLCFIYKLILFDKNMRYLFKYSKYNAKYY